MVFVAVGDEYCPHPVGILQQIGDVGDDQVYPWQVFSGELDPAVDDNYIVAALQGHHIFANLP